jgi:hypothetical protein
MNGTSALAIVVGVTAAVMTPLILFGVYFGYYVADQVGYDRSVMAIAFSTVGFVVGIVVVFRVIRFVVSRVRATAQPPS